MALFSVDIQKELDGEFWTNRYMVEVADLEAGVLVGQDIVELEREIHNTAVDFTKLRVSDTVPGTDIFTVVPLTGQGNRAAVGDFLPLFNVVRVDFQAAAGRPSRKYLRLPLVEGDATFNAIGAGVIGFINTFYANPLVAMPEFVDVDGQAIVGAAVHPQVGMRQLRRGSRRRTTPIIP